ncbi:hypothetical protein SeLEV6574_g00429 [Synchytrium endobioticum]|uniref:Deacetylase sirtuin-type domain-containing protein n=1 Tax=Synchytrium endobioticum TaxID=286115 RepID=A0A507DJX2_9FUNG|nr:hypothetical protein SeLEV6574_g00429 [Synchytrium endobioticum]
MEVHKRPAKKAKAQHAAVASRTSDTTNAVSNGPAPRAPPSQSQIDDHPSIIHAVPPDLHTQIRHDSRRMPYDDFIAKYLTGMHVTMRQLLLVFGLTADASTPDGELTQSLKFVIDTLNAKRQPLEHINNVDDVVTLLKESKKIMVLTGAGVSVSAGIPDFRSVNGIYSRLSEFALNDPQEMFDIEYFRSSPQTFYSFAKEIYPSNFKPTPSHMFIKLLQDRGQLLRNYTQNIDTLENEAGITAVIQCHGSFATARCISCGYAVPGEQIRADIFEQRVPWCPMCSDADEGILKPDIVFFGESLPSTFDNYFASDRTQADLLLVMGSSLKVAPVGNVMNKLPHHVPQILINLESLPHMSGFDVQLLGDCDEIVKYLCTRLGWELPEPRGWSKETRVLDKWSEFVEPNKYVFGKAFFGIRGGKTIVVGDNTNGNISGSASATNKSDQAQET